MWSMTVTSISAFFQGKLFADNLKAFGSIGIGLAITAVIFLGACKAGLQYWQAAACAGLIGGAVQPALLKNVKYR